VEEAVAMRVRRGRRALVGGLIGLWITVFVLGFVSQATELFGAHSSVLALLLLALAAVGFVLIGAVGMWLVVRGLDGRSDSRGDA
jgi:putative Mn2+ efflux pump MntP